jgi:outer membrane protein OmpA-like peptidoglycan-associated protein
MASSLPRLLATYVASAQILLAAVASPATAQTASGARSTPSVTVDLSVLDALGPRPTLRDKPTPRQSAVTTSRPRPTTGLPAPKKPEVEARHRKPKPEIAARPVAPVATAGTAAAPREQVTASPLSELAAPTAPTPGEAPAKEPVATPSTAVVAPKAPEIAAAPAELPPAPPTKPAAPALTPTTRAPTPPPPVTPPRLLPTATPSSDARTAMSTPPAVAPQPPVPAAAAPQPAAPTPVGAAASTRIVFSAGAADLPDAAKGDLDAVARQLGSNNRTRLQLVGYAGSTTDEANQARRISLQRALAVRSYLMEHGVPNTRMDVRALGNRADGKDPSDRVDVVLLDR